MKKGLALPALACATVFMLSGCSFSPSSLLQGKDIQVEFTEAQKANYSWADSYGETLGIYRSRKGNFSEVIDDSQGLGVVKDRKGVFFCNLFDWNADGTPEMVVGYSDGKKESLNAQSLEVYSYNGSFAKPLLIEAPGSEYSQKSDTNTVKFIKHDDGTYTIRIAHSYGNGEKNDYCFYSFENDEVKCTKLYFGSIGADEELSAPPETTTAAPETEKESTTVVEEESSSPAEEEEDKEVESSAEAGDEEIPEDKAATSAEEAIAEDTTEEKSKESEEETTKVPETTKKAKKAKIKYYRIDDKDCTEEEFNTRLSELDSDNAIIINLDEGTDVTALFNYLTGTAKEYNDPVFEGAFSAQELYE